MKKLLLPLTIGLCVGVTAGCDTDTEERYEAAQVPEETTHVVFADLDTDRDQMLTRVEADRVTSLDAVFDDLDTNDDNRLTSEEFTAISEWDEDLDSDQHAVVTAMSTFTTTVDESATASRFDQDQGLDRNRSDLSADREADVYDSDWPRTGDNTMADVDTDVESDYQQLDPREDTSLNREDRTAMSDDDSAYQLDTETDTTTAQMQSEVDAESSVSLADVRVNEEPTLELVSGESPESLDHQTTQNIFDEADADGDNRLAREEAVEIDGLAAVFADIDEDGDGTLAFTEFETLNGVS